ncbi:glutathione S-transferase [Psychromonas aquimarina]|uniref:glutathione S-transferase n=1 Tax=Psychromonas aquimarina TaxID=444919 RepID=UPI00048B631A|nr:glutathione S-transferase family protein [Psychromonas aquimarina]
MYQLSLTYFDIAAGRAEPARLAMHIGSIPFEDIRFPFSQFAEVKKKTPLNQVPVLTIDGRQITQCNSINRFIGKLAGLYPEDNFQAMLCDEIMSALEDAVNKLMPTFHLPEKEMKNAREALAAGPFTLYLQRNGGTYFADNRLTMADLKVFEWVRTLNSGFLDHIPATLVENTAPLLNEHMQRIAQIPAVAEYYAKG